jgi:asparagine synthase (glutamine-hydrolysing)
MTAALSGLGGDELFGGYPSFRNAPRLARMLPWWRALPEFIRQPVLNRWARGDSRQAKLAGMLRHAQNIDDLADRQRQVLHDEVRAELLSASSPGPPHPAYSELRELTTGRSPQEVVSWWETRTYMTDVLLRDSDVFSMRASLELRVPFVDRPLLEWLARQPSAWRFDSQSPKGTLVRAVADILPPGLLNRPKQGFSFPFAQWMRNALRPFMEDTLSANFVARTGIINPTAATEMWKQFCNSTDDRQWSRAWSLAMLVAFLNRSTTDA